MTSRLSGRTASKKRMGMGAGSSTTWCYATLTAGFHKEVSPGSFARIAGVNSYFASRAKPGVFVRHATPKEPRSSQLFFKRSFCKTSAMPSGVFPFPKCSAPTFSSTESSSPSSPAQATKTVHELMAAAVEDSNVRVGMVASIQTFSDNLKWNPHLHSIVSRGVWRDDGQWIPVPYIDTHAAEILFREKVFRLLQAHDLLSDERIKILRSWRRSGFSIDNDVYLYPSDTKPLNPFLATSSDAPSPYKDSVTTKRATTFSISPNQKIEKPSSSTRSSSSPACSSTFPSPTSIRSCTTVTTPDEQENIPERNDLHLTTTSSTPLSVKPFADDGPI